MALAGSGTLSINDIAGEFGGRSDPESLSEFYRGGSRVPNNATNVNQSNNFGTWIDANFDVANSNPMLDVVYPVAQITGNIAGFNYNANVSLSGLAGKTIVDSNGSQGAVPNPVESSNTGYGGFGVLGRPNNSRAFGFNCAVGGSTSVGVTSTLIIQ